MKKKKNNKLREVNKTRRRTQNKNAIKAIKIENHMKKQIKIPTFSSKAKGIRRQMLSLYRKALNRDSNKIKIRELNKIISAIQGPEI